jgi:hypothetical protein
MSRYQLRPPPYSCLNNTTWTGDGKAIRRILDHLGLWQERIPKGLPPPEVTIAETIVCEEFDDAWGGEVIARTSHCIDFGGCAGDGLCKIQIFLAILWL